MKVINNGVERDMTPEEIAEIEALQQVNEKENEEIQKLIFRVERNQLLATTDWTQSPDSPLSDSKKTEWAEYRQALRQLPETETNFNNPTWPKEPT